MTYYPYSRELKEAAGNENNFSKFKNGNFGLWYNKFVPLQGGNNKDPYKPAEVPTPFDKKGKEETHDPVGYYEKKSVMMGNAEKLLEKKQVNQLRFCESMERFGMKTLVFHAKLTSPLVTGIGESHPHEISMVFDHTTGIPYLPASGIKGVARLAYIIDQVLEEKDGTKVVKEEFSGSDEINEKDVEGLFSHFGSHDNRGGIMFLDAYPVTVPSLKADIMTPHYPDYYSNENSTTPPADNQGPRPIKFLTIPAGTEFVFRVLIDEKNIDAEDAGEDVAAPRCGVEYRDAQTTHTTHQRHVATIVGAALKEGVGAKTALGYGRFEIAGTEEPGAVQKIVQKQKEEKRKIKVEKKLAQMSDLEKTCYTLETATKQCTMEFYNNELSTFEGEEKKRVANALKKRWEDLGCWSGKISKKQVVKVRAVKEILGES